MTSADDVTELLSAMRNRTPGIYNFIAEIAASGELDVEARESWLTQLVIFDDGRVEMRFEVQRLGEETTSVAAGVTLRPGEFFAQCLSQAEGQDWCGVATCFREPFEPESCTQDLACFGDFASHGTPCD